MCIESDAPPRQSDSDLDEQIRRMRIDRERESENQTDNNALAKQKFIEAKELELLAKTQASDARKAQHTADVENQVERQKLIDENQAAIMKLSQEKRDTEDLLETGRQEAEKDYEALDSKTRKEIARLKEKVRDLNAAMKSTKKEAKDWQSQFVDLQRKSKLTVIDAWKKIMGSTNQRMIREKMQELFENIDLVENKTLLLKNLLNTEKMWEAIEPTFRHKVIAALQAQIKVLERSDDFLRKCVVLTERGCWTDTIINNAAGLSLVRERSEWNYNTTSQTIYKLTDRRFCFKSEDPRFDTESKEEERAPARKDECEEMMDDESKSVVKIGILGRDYLAKEFECANEIFGNDKRDTDVDLPGLTDDDDEEVSYESVDDSGCEDLIEVVLTEELAADISCDIDTAFDTKENCKGYFKAQLEYVMSCVNRNLSARTRKVLVHGLRMMTFPTKPALRAAYDKWLNEYENWIPTFNVRKAVIEPSFALIY